MSTIKREEKTRNPEIKINQFDLRSPNVLFRAFLRFIGIKKGEGALKTAHEYLASSLSIALFEGHSFFINEAN